MKRYDIQVAGSRWLTDFTFEIAFVRPAGFSFTPGQKIRILDEPEARDYTLINGPESDYLTLCVRLIPEGHISPRLAAAKPGDNFRGSGPFGYFLFQSTVRQAVFVATGTGIAPFVAFVRAGIKGFDLLHGVREPGELYYHQELVRAARSATGCLSADGGKENESFYRGRVTDYLENHLAPGTYDFYLCGGSSMISEATQLIDDRFPGCLVFSENFY